MNGKELLDILADERIHGILEKNMKDNDLYQSAQKQQDSAYTGLKEVRLDKEQNQAIDRVVSAVNHCGAVYGALAYRQGMLDGIELVMEVLGI